eukprot:5341685-Pyramimonas_sp.AAC.1
MDKGSGALGQRADVGGDRGPAGGRELGCAPSNDDGGGEVCATDAGVRTQRPEPVRENACSGTVAT